MPSSAIDAALDPREGMVVARMALAMVPGGGLGLRALQLLGRLESDPDEKPTP
jgi:hypothetical protein